MIEHAIVPDEFGPCILIPSQFFQDISDGYGPLATGRSSSTVSICRTHDTCPVRASAQAGIWMGQLSQLLAQSTLHQTNVLVARNEFELCFTGGYAKESLSMHDASLSSWHRQSEATGTAHSAAGLFLLFVLSRLVFLASALRCQSGIFQLGWQMQIQILLLQMTMLYIFWECLVICRQISSYDKICQFFVSFFSVSLKHL